MPLVGGLYPAAGVLALVHGRHPVQIGMVHEEDGVIRSHLRQQAMLVCALNLRACGERLAHESEGMSYTRDLNTSSICQVQAVTAWLSGFHTLGVMITRMQKSISPATPSFSRRTLTAVLRRTVVCVAHEPATVQESLRAGVDTAWRVLSTSSSGEARQNMGGCIR